MRQMVLVFAIKAGELETPQTARERKGVKVDTRLSPHDSQSSRINARPRTALYEYLRALGEAVRRLISAQSVLPNAFTTHGRVTAQESDRDSGL